MATAKSLRFPDVDGLLVQWLHERLPDLDVAGERPADTDWPRVTRPVAVVQVTDTAPAKSLVLTEQSFLVEVWAPSSVAAFDAAADAAQELGYLPGTQDDVRVYQCVTSAPLLLPDPVAGITRYIVNGRITCRLT